MTTIFITGTDTNVGKTYVTSILLKKLKENGWKTFGIKPIASGCEISCDGTLHNTDALQLIDAASIKKPYNIVNPIALAEPIAPHLAAAKSGINITKDLVKKHILSSLQPDANINLIEGAGGWAVPLNYHELYADVVTELKLPVILVVGIKLGCINHAILTVRDILTREVPLLGWIANRLHPDTLVADENIATLRAMLDAPFLGDVPYAATN